MNIRIRRTDNEEELLACARLFTENYPWKGLDETFEYNNAKVHYRMKRSMSPLTATRS